MFITVPALGLLFLQNSQIQTFLTAYVTEKISQKLHAKITIEQVSVTFVNRLRLKNLYIEDQNGDTLLYARNIKAILRRYNKNERELVFSRISLDDSYINLKTDTSGVLNLKFILNELKGRNKKDSSEFIVRINNVDLTNSRFHYSRDGRKPVLKGINYADMDFTGLNLNIGDFESRGDTISYLIKNTSFQEKSGLRINNLTTGMSFSDRHMNFSNVSLETPKSVINADNLNLSFFSFDDFLDFENLVEINFNIKPSVVSFGDISFFAPALIGYEEIFTVSGELKGQISNLKGTDILLSYNQHTRLKANFTMFGLPDINSTYMNFDFTSLITNTEDLSKFTLPGGDNKTRIKIPETVSKFGNIKYSGKFTGYLDDFVAYGKFSTDLGEFSSDLLLRPETSNSLFFQGKLKAKNFNIGNLIDQDSLVGKITMNANIIGSSSKSSISAKLDALVDSVDFSSYNYKNINITGALTDKIFDGSFNITDPNIKMDFQGKVNFSNENPEFDFTADVSRARPYYLHLADTDPAYFVSFLLETNFTGKNIDQLNGEIRVINSLFQNKTDQLQMYNFVLMANNTSESNSVNITSDVIDATISGQYKLSSLPSSFKNLIANYLPSLNEEKLQNELIDKNHFDFTIKLKNIHPLVTFFLPEFDLANNTEVTGHYRPDIKDVSINANSDLFVFDENELRNITIESNTNFEEFKLNTRISQILLSNKLIIDNISASSVVHKDTASLLIDWRSNSGPQYKGALAATANLQRNSSSRKPVIGLDFKPSEIIFNDTLWHISESKVVLDSSSIAIDSFTIRNKNQNFVVHGTISQDPEDAIRMSFIDLDLSTLNIFTRKINLNLAGKLSGLASIKDPYKNMTFLSDLQMKDLYLNGEEFGIGELLANWNNTSKKIHVKSFIGRGLIPALQVEGDFSPQTKSLNLTADLDKFRLNPFQIYASELVSDIRGIATGKLILTGTTEKPELNGDIRLMKTSMLVNYLQTRYNFSNDIKITQNNIIFRNFELFDEKGNKAIAQGVITNRYFDDFNLDIKLETDNFAFLNTIERDNPLFYGRIYAGGVIRVTGPPDNLLMNITARSEKNSVFFIPLYATEDVAVRNFIDWVDSSAVQPGIAEDKTKYEVKIKGIQLNFNLEITPDAEVQLLFDPKVGDIIKGSGTGNLKILINTLGKFEIYGDMSIEQGDYLFTLQNVINKKFTVEKGGRISWNGDPSDANLEMKAIYGLKTTISALDPDPEKQTSRKRIPVECVINLSGKLMNPTIKPDINLPGADQQTQNIVKNSINTDEEMMKQFVSLLVMNNFYSQQNFSQGATSGTTNIAGVTTFELLSNQLTSWLSQISKDFDIGVNYRPGDQITSDELQVALSTQILNDRVSISGNFDVGGNEAATSNVENTKNIVGDFDISFKITEKLHVKAFNRANDNLLFQTSEYTQGVGLFYKEYFNTFGDWLNIFKRDNSPDAIPYKNSEEISEEKEE